MMAMCAACQAMLEGQHAGDGHAALMSKGRRGYRVFGKSRNEGGEHYVCRVCGSEWRRDHGMHLIERSGFRLPTPHLLQRRADPSMKSKR
jgi:hypothetical protein